MVDVGGAAVDVCEEGDVFLAVGGCGVGGIDVKEVAGGDVEGAGVEVDQGVKFGGADAVVAELRCKLSLVTRESAAIIPCARQRGLS